MTKGFTGSGVRLVGQRSHEEEVHEKWSVPKIQLC